MLRKPSLFTLMLVLQTSGLSAAEATDTEAALLVDRALVALGGTKKLSGIKAAIFKTKGKFYWFGAGTDFTGEMAVQGLAKGRTVMTFEFLGKKQTIITVVNGDKGWVQARHGHGNRPENPGRSNGRPRLHHGNGDAAALGVRRSRDRPLPGW